jgi:hypothetical protein
VPLGRPIATSKLGATEVDFWPLQVCVAIWGCGRDSSGGSEVTSPDRAEYLFVKGDLQAILAAHGEKMASAARAIDADRVLTVPIEDLISSLVEEYIVHPVQLDEDAMTSSGATDMQIWVQGSVREIAVDGTAVEWTVPFSGDAVLLHARPSSYTMNPPRAEIRGSALVFRYEGRSPIDPSAAKTALTGALGEVKGWLNRQLPDIDNFNANLPERLRNLLAGRRDKVLKDRELDAFLEIPLQGRSDRSATFAIDPPPVQRPPLRTNPSGTQPFEPEPAISTEGFAAILAELSNATAAVERLPQTFSGMPEESLRDLLLVVLNNRFGPATGETFSRKGKTDILVSYGSDQRAVFIAECKWWSGASGFASAIDQLLGYLTWRDSKAALVIFSDRKEPTSIAGKARDVLIAHQAFKREGGVLSGVPTFVLRQPADEMREINVALLMVPVIDNA